MLWLSALVDGQQACSTRTHRSSIKVGEGSALQGCGFTGSTFSHTSYWDSSGEIIMFMFGVEPNSRAITSNHEHITRGSRRFKAHNSIERAAIQWRKEGIRQEQAHTRHASIQHPEPSWHMVRDSFGDDLHANFRSRTNGNSNSNAQRN